MTRAACAARSTGIFFEQGTVPRAKAVCCGCPVRSQCLDYAVRNEIHSGVWGGASEADRRRTRSSGLPLHTRPEPG